MYHAKQNICIGLQKYLKTVNENRFSEVSSRCKLIRGYTLLTLDVMMTKAAT